MGVILVVPPGVLVAAERAWDDAHDKLDGAGARIDDVVISSLSTEAAAAVRSFQQVWSAETEVLARRAETHAQGFADLRADLGVTDADGAERLRSLLPWAHRHAPILDV